MKVLVTGGAGFIGSHLVDELVKEFHEVSVIDDLSTGKLENLNPQAQFHQLEISSINSGTLASIINGSDVVFHLAALPRVQETIEDPVKANRINVDATLNLLHSSYKAGVKKLIFASSCSVYGDSEISPFNEESTPLNPKSPYALQKIIGEQYCKFFSAPQPYGIATASLRFFNVYGPRMNPEGAYPLAIGVFLNQKKNGRPMTITGDGEQTRDFVHVSDVCRALIYASKLKKLNGEIINIGSGRECSMNYVAELIGGDRVHIPPRYEPRNTRADIGKARKLLNWEPKVSLESGIAELKQLYLP